MENRDFDAILSETVKDAVEHVATINWVYLDQRYRTYADGCTYAVELRSCGSGPRTVAGRTIAPGV